MSKKVVTMGEIMLRLSTPNNEKFIQADEFDINYGGGEANVAVSLANYGHEAQFVTAVPDNELGECAVAALRKYNVGTQNIARCGERLVSTTWSQVLPCVLPRLYMIELILLSLQLQQQILISIRSSKVLTGSISQVSHQLFLILQQY